MIRMSKRPFLFGFTRLIVGFILTERDQHTKLVLAQS